MDGYLKGRPETSWWIQQIRHGIEYRKKCASEPSWNDWRSYYRGKWKPGIMPSNIFFKMMRTIVPRIYFRNPAVSIVPRRPGIENMVFAQVLERTDNKLIRTMRVKQNMKAIVQDAFMFGTGIGKLGFGAQYTPTPDEIDTVRPQGKDGKGLVEYHADVQDNMPWFMRVPTGSFIVPDQVESLRASPWAAHWVKRPLDEVRNDPRLKNTANLMPSHKAQTTQFGKIGRSVDMVDLVEIRDKRTSKVIVLAPYLVSDKAILFDDDEMQYDGGLPFYDVVFNEDDEYFWGVPDSKILEPLQLELNEIRTLQMKHRRLSLVRILAKRLGINEQEAEKLVSETVSPVIWTEEDPNRVVKIIESGGIPRDLITAEDLIHRDTRETLGFSRNEFGEYVGGSGDTTATEAQIVKAASEIRVDERRDMLADVLIDVMSDTHRVMFDQWDTDQVIDIVGPAGVQVWVTFKGQMLSQGQYDINIDPDTSVPETRQVREQRAMGAYRELKQNPLIDPLQLTRYLLTELKGTQFDTMLRNGYGTFQQPLPVDAYANAMGELQQKGIQPQGGPSAGPA